MSPGLYFQNLSGRSQSLPEPGLLLLVGDVQHHLDDDRAAVDDAHLERVDLAVAPGPRPLRHQLVHPCDQHVLVVRTVEHPDLAGLRQRVADPPEERVRLLLRGGRLEGRVADPLRVHRTHDMAHDPALAGGVHALHHQQDRAVAAGAGLGVEPLLQVVELLVGRGHQLRRLGLAAGEPRCRPRVQGGQHEPLPRPQRHREGGVRGRVGDLGRPRLTRRRLVLPARRPLPPVPLPPAPLPPVPLPPVPLPPAPLAPLDPALVFFPLFAMGVIVALALPARDPFAGLARQRGQPGHRPEVLLAVATAHQVGCEQVPERRAAGEHRHVPVIQAVGEHDQP